MTKHYRPTNKLPKLPIVRKWYFRWIEEYERTGIESFANQAVATLLLAFVVYDESTK